MQTGKGGKGMTIKKRLALSNVLMILVPVVITMIIALACLGMILSMITHGQGLSFDDNEDFYQAGSGLAASVIQTLKTSPDNRASRLNKLTSMIDEQNMSLAVFCNGKPFYQYGKKSSSEAKLVRTVDKLGNTAMATDNKRGVYALKRHIGDNYYSIYIFSKVSHLTYSTLKKAIITSAVILAVVIVLAIFFTDRFLIRFVFRRIEEPLDTLADGVHAIGQGNLDYRIHYDRKDEFLPVCQDFNKMADHLQMSIEEVQKHEESRKVLLADISHDICSPLTSILAYVEGLMDGIAQTEEMRNKYLRTIHDKALAIQGMISQIFMFSKMDLDQYKPVMRELDLNQEIHDMLEKDKDRYEKEGLSIHTDLPPEPLLVLGDSGLIQRILSNIAGNSLKYKEGDCGNLKISLKEIRKDSETHPYWAQLTMEDDGPGVREDELQKIFSSFYRSDQARKNPDKGSGLGLAIVEKAVSSMKGQLRAENVNPHGLRIIIEIPEGAEDE
jgi:signal transduction histidine kinase